MAGARLMLTVPRDPPSRGWAETWQPLSRPQPGSSNLGELPDGGEGKGASPPRPPWGGQSRGSKAEKAASLPGPRALTAEPQEGHGEAALGQGQCVVLHAGTAAHVAQHHDNHVAGRAPPPPALPRHQQQQRQGQRQQGHAGSRHLGGPATIT